MTTEFRAILGMQEERKQKAIAQLKAKLAGSDVPVSQATLDALTRLFISDFVDVMRHHPGFVMEDKVRSLKTTFALFQRAHFDLLAALDEFDALSKSPEFGHANNRRIHDKLECVIRKELYCFSSLAHSLQDHCRRLTAVWKPIDYQENLNTIFGADCLHDFVCGLRTALHHRSMIEADWLLRSSNDGVTSHYILKKSELATVEKAWTARGRSALDKMEPQIDVRILSNEYYRRTDQFYNWFFRSIENEAPPGIIDYRRCWVEHERHAARWFWRAALKFAMEQKIDPYAQLHKYLEADQLEEAMNLPMRSKEQVDCIISFVDRFGACTDEIRHSVYCLFGICTGQDSDTA